MALRKIKRSAYIPLKIAKRLDSLARETGVPVGDLINAALVTKLSEWPSFEPDELFRQDICIGRGNNGADRISHGATVVVPDEIIAKARELISTDRAAAVATLVSWWNESRPADLPAASLFDIFGTPRQYGCSYTPDCPDRRRPHSFEGTVASAKAHGLYLEFRFHRTAPEGMIEIINMSGDYIESCRVGLDSYVWWASEALAEAFRREWSEVH